TTSTTVPYRLTFDASGDVRTDTYTHPNSVSGVWCIQAFGSVVNPGSVDAAQLASDLAALDAAFQALSATVASGNVGLGAGQAWYDETASRVQGTTYTNTYGRPIMVNVTVYTSSTNSASFYVDGVCVSFAVANATANFYTLSAIVPGGATYRLAQPAGLLSG